VPLPTTSLFFLHCLVSLEESSVSGLLCSNAADPAFILVFVNDANVVIAASADEEEARGQ